MKKAIIILVLVLFAVPAIADFQTDFDLFALIYGFDRLEKVSSSGYKLTTVEIMVTSEITLYAEENDIADLFAAACCAMRTIDNQGDMLDQYGRLLHAYFLSRAAGGEEKHATTETGIMIFFSTSSGLITVRLVK